MGQKERISRLLEPAELEDRSLPPATTLRLTKARVISLSTHYLTLELHEPTDLQQGQQVIVSKA